MAGTLPIPTDQRRLKTLINGICAAFCPESPAIDLQQYDGREAEILQLLWQVHVTCNGQDNYIKQVEDLSRKQGRTESANLDHARGLWWASPPITGYIVPPPDDADRNLGDAALVGEAHASTTAFLNLLRGNPLDEATDEQQAQLSLLDEETTQCTLEAVRLHVQACMQAGFPADAPHSGIDEILALASHIAADIATEHKKSSRLWWLADTDDRNTEDAKQTLWEEPDDAKVRAVLDVFRGVPQAEGSQQLAGLDQRTFEDTFQAVCLHLRDESAHGARGMPLDSNEAIEMVVKDVIDEIQHASSIPTASGASASGPPLALYLSHFNLHSMTQGAEFSTTSTASSAASVTNGSPPSPRTR